MRGAINHPRTRQRWRIHLMCNRPRPGGEPLWHVPGRPEIFVSNANTAETRENRRLPRTSQSDASRVVLDTLTPGP